MLSEMALASINGLIGEALDSAGGTCAGSRTSPWPATRS